MSESILRNPVLTLPCVNVAVREVKRSSGDEEPVSTLEDSFQTKNTAEGRDRLVETLKEVGLTRVVLEASGGLERPVVATLGAANLPVVVVNPIQTSEFAKSLGRLEKTERELGKLIEESPVWQAEEDLLCSVPGIGKTTARVLLARLPELGEANREEIAKLVGLAPIAQESGTWNGERHIEGGRADVRRALYMATVACVQHNDRIGAFYRRLVDRGKEAKVALIAAARKLLVILNTMLKNQTEWRPEHSPATA